MPPPPAERCAFPECPAVDMTEGALVHKVVHTVLAHLPESPQNHAFVPTPEPSP